MWMRMKSPGFTTCTSTGKRCVTGVSWDIRNVETTQHNFITMHEVPRHTKACSGFRFWSQPPFSTPFLSDPPLTSWHPDVPTSRHSLCPKMFWLGSGLLLVNLSDCLSPPVYLLTPCPSRRVTSSFEPFLMVTVNFPVDAAPQSSAWTVSSYLFVLGVCK